VTAISRNDQVDPNVELCIGKIHTGSHLSHLGLDNGSIDSVNCSHMESYHRERVTAIFSKTSGRYASNVKEMGQRTAESIVLTHEELARKIKTSNNVAQFISRLSKRDKPNRKRDCTRSFRKAKNARGVRWIGGAPEMLAKHMHPSAVLEFEARMNVFIPVFERCKFVLTVVTGIRVDGSNQSPFQDGTILYCTPKLGRENFARYSAISFYDEGGEVSCGVLVAAVCVQVVGALQSSKMLLHVAVMELSTEREIPSFWRFERYKFVYARLIVIEESNMIDHLFMYPDFHPGHVFSLSTTTLGQGERYWLVPRTLFERNGVVDVADICDLASSDNVQSTRDCLSANQAKGLLNPNAVKQFDKYSTTEGFHSQANT